MTISESLKIVLNSTPMQIIFLIGIVIFNTYLVGCIKRMNRYKKTYTRKPKQVFKNNFNIAFCPRCKGSVWQNKDESRYCFRCGQRIKWDQKSRKVHSNTFRESHG